jgi:hypothetical protein
MTFLNLHLPALVFREQLGPWRRKGRSSFSQHFRKLAPKREEPKGSPLPSRD